jgi:ribose 5-phosphate isomerase B
MTALTLVIGSDHRGLALKTLFKARLTELGHNVVDVGTDNESSCDAGDFAQKVALDLRDHPEHVGILICMSGQAMAMTANRYRHIRAALCMNTTMARLARQHNNANVLVLGAGLIGQEVALECLDTFLETKFLEGRFIPRCDKLLAMGGL